jgi:hypothetical protein
MPHIVLDGEDYQKGCAFIFRRGHCRHTFKATKRSKRDMTSMLADWITKSRLLTGISGTFCLEMPANK